MLSAHDRYSLCQKGTNSIKNRKKRSHNEPQLTFDSKVLAVIWNYCCNLHTIGNYCAKYEHLGQTMTYEFSLHLQTSFKYMGP